MDPSSSIPQIRAGHVLWAKLCAEMAATVVAKTDLAPALCNLQFGGEMTVVQSDSDCRIYRVLWEHRAGIWGFQGKEREGGLWKRSRPRDNTALNSRREEGPVWLCRGA